MSIRNFADLKLRFNFYEIFSDFTLQKSVKIITKDFGFVQKFALKLALNVSQIEFKKITVLCIFAWRKSSLFFKNAKYAFYLLIYYQINKKNLIFDFAYRDQ